MVNPTQIQFAFGIFLGIVFAWLALRAHALSRSGAFAAAISGGLIFGLGGWPWAVLLLVFFISSSALSRLFARRKTAVNEKFAKGSQRDWGQVLANGGLGVLLVFCFTWRPDSTWMWVAYAGALAAVNADTWATELGVLSRHPPRLLTNGKIVERGESGGVSTLGSLAALGGALMISIAAIFVSDANWRIFIAVMLGGVAGSFFDSLLGAKIQAMYFCPTCGKETERSPVHSCGTATTWRRGWRWLNNDWVNFACSLTGALITLGLWALAGH